MTSQRLVWSAPGLVSALLRTHSQRLARGAMEHGMCWFARLLVCSTPGLVSALLDSWFGQRLARGAMEHGNDRYSGAKGGADLSFFPAC